MAKVFRVNNWPELLDHWEALMRKGQGQEIKQNLRGLNLAQVPREYASQVTNFSHRLNLPSIGLRLLNPHVRPKDYRLQNATQKEKSEYAVALFRIGAVAEANKLLTEINGYDIPTRFLYLGFGHMTQWQYKKAITAFNSFLRIKGLDSYQRLIAKVNLAASYVFIGKTDKAQTLLDNIIQYTKRKKLSLLNGNAHELMAQVHIQKKNESAARDSLNNSYDQLIRSKTIGIFFVKKWRTVLSLQNCSDENFIRQSLNIIRSEAKKLRHWETLRHCDYYELKFLYDENLFNHIYCGTPYSDFRQNILKEFSDKKAKPNYIWCPSHRDEQPKHFIDIDSASFNFNCESTIKPHQLNHRLLMALSEDFYKSFGIGHLFGRLFPEEYYNPLTSPDRVHKSIQRFRKWSNKFQINLDIIEHKGDYKLHSSADIGLRILSRRNANLSKNDLLKNHLKQKVLQKAFSAKIAMEQLNISRGQWNQLARQLKSENNLFSHGNGPSLRYTFSKKTLRMLQTRKV